MKFNKNILLMADSAEGNGEAVNTPEPETEEKELILGEHEGITFVKKEFKVGKDGEKNPISGFGFPVPRYTSVNQLVSHLDRLIKEQSKEGVTGESIVLANNETATAAKLRMKVKSATPNIGDVGFKTQTDIANWFDKQAIDNPNKLLMSLADAYNYIPGLRDISGAKKQASAINNLNELVAKVMRDNNCDKATAFKTDVVQDFLIKSLANAF